jgi:hypothetical protein
MRRQVTAARARSPRALFRDCAVALASAAVVAFLVGYALTTPRFTLRTTVSGVEHHPGSAAIVQGRVLEADGDGVGDAEVRVRRARGVSRVTRTGEEGRFRVDLGGSCAASRIEVSVRTEAKIVRSTLRRQLCPGDAVEVDARLVTRGHLIWVPAT